jgi:hypothetical protein
MTRTRWLWLEEVIRKHERTDEEGAVIDEEEPSVAPREAEASDWDENPREGARADEKGKREAGHAVGPQVELSMLGGGVRERGAKADEHIEEGRAKARRGTHPRVACSSEGGVCDKVTDGVAPRENGESENALGYVESLSQEAEDGDDLAGDGVRPEDGHEEAEQHQRHPQ